MDDAVFQQFETGSLFAPMDFKPTSYIGHTQVWLEEANLVEAECLLLRLNNPSGHLDEICVAIPDDPPCAGVGDECGGRL